MIPKDQIDYIKQNANLREVFECCGVEVHRSGSTYNCKCPFHEEKTPSCHIFTNTNTWKCFGCGEGGNVIDFVTKKTGRSFIEAVKYVADLMHYTITDDYEETDEDRLARSKREIQLNINKDAMIWFQMQLRKSAEAQKYVQSRKWNSDTLNNWSIGYAPNNYAELWTYLKDKGYRSDELSDSDLFAKAENGSYYSFFRDRIMFPIMNLNHEPIAFTGRVLHLTPENKAYKYFNSKNSNLYTKGKEFFGLDLARASISKKNFAILVEGNPDTIKLHEIGITNTIAACGTSLTTEHAKRLSKLTRTVVLLYDNDSGGQGAIIKNAPILINEGFTVWVLPLPQGEKKIDPDEFFLSKSHFEEFDDKERVNIFEYLARMNAKRCEEPQLASDFARDMATLLVKLDDCTCSAHIDNLSRIIPTKRMWNEAVKIAKKNLQKDPKRIDENGYTKEQIAMINEYGFFEKEHSYRIQPAPDAAGHYVSNFVLEPLFHIESTINAKRLYRLTNNRGIVRVIEIAQKDLVSISAFKVRVESLGNFLFEGGEADLNKIKRYLYEHTKTCKEVEQLGWQREGFWAWSNGVISPTLEWTKLDDLGIVEYSKHWYYLPALSKFFENESQLFQFERRFIHTDSDANLFTLADKMYSVYGDNGIVGLGFYLATVFRDIIYTRHNSFPILNIFGQKGTGKTEMAITLLKLFGTHCEGLNMTNSTLPAMADHVSHVRNALIHIDEYKNSVDPEKIEFLKGLYDGVGRSRMNMDKDKKKEMTPVDCGLILTGQEMPNKDNALLSRTIFLSVSRTKFTKEQNNAYEDLKKYEKNGLTSITNSLLKYREAIANNYNEEYNSIHDELSDIGHIEGRILANWSMILAVFKVLLKHVKLPYDYSKIKSVVVSGMENQNTEVNSNSEISTFWENVKALLVQGKIEHSYDIRIDKGTTNLSVYKGMGSSKRNITYSQALDVIYLNPNRIFIENARLMKSTSDNRSSFMDKNSLKHYLMSQEEFLGIKQMSWKSPTSELQQPNDHIQRDNVGKTIRGPRHTSRSLAFNYEAIKRNYNVDLEVEDELDPELKKIVDELTTEKK